MAVSVDPPPPSYWEGRGLVWLWVAMLLAPAAWVVDQGLSYASVKPSCAGGTEAPLFGYAAAALAMVVAGGGIAWWCLHRLREATDDGGRVVDRSRFVAVVAIGFNALIGLLILTATMPIFMLNPCE
jgi:hypothetical protein